MLYSEYADAVRVTARDLDAVEPSWYRPDRVDLDRLNMASLCDCLLGQVFGYYSVGLNRLASHRTDVDQEGMFCDRFVHEHVVATGGGVPAELWRREVLARRDADSRVAVERRTFAARVTPEVRRRWVEQLRAQPHVVAPAPTGPGRSALTQLVAPDDREYVSQAAS